MEKNDNFENFILKDDKFVIRKIKININTNIDILKNYIFDHKNMKKFNHFVKKS